jgi:membrane associated rhomboid family serine protease
MLSVRGIAPVSIVGWVGPWPDMLDLFQAKNSALIIYKFHFHRLITPALLHISLVHIAANMYLQVSAHTVFCFARNSMLQFT